MEQNTTEYVDETITAITSEQFVKSVYPNAKVFSLRETRKSTGDHVAIYYRVFEDGTTNGRDPHKHKFGSFPTEEEAWDDAKNRLDYRVMTKLQEGTL